jgi:hypothetical protein
MQRLSYRRKCIELNSVFIGIYVIMMQVPVMYLNSTDTARMHARLYTESKDGDIWLISLLQTPRALAGSADCRPAVISHVTK